MFENRVLYIMIIILLLLGYYFGVNKSYEHGKAVGKMEILEVERYPNALSPTRME